MHYVLKSLIAFTFFTFSISILGADTAKEEFNKYVEPTHDGKVSGRVYDAENGEPIPNAAISLDDGGAFSDSGKSTAITDQTGKYTAISRIGRVSTSFNFGRAINSSIIGLLTGSANDTTKRIDISRLNIRVICPGYKKFEGIVPANNIDSNGFIIEMCPILLIKEAATNLSIAAPDWGTAGISQCSINPSIARPGSEVKITVKVKCPQAAIDKKTSLQLYSIAFANKTISKPQYTDGTATFEVNYKISSKLKSGAELAYFQIQGFSADYISGAKEATSLFQVVRTDEEEQLAIKREQAFKLKQENSNVEAAAVLKDICQSKEATLRDYLVLAQLSESINDFKTAVYAWSAAATMTPEKTHIYTLSSKASAMLHSGDYDEIISECAPIIEKIKPRERVARIPASLMTSVGQAYLKNNDIQKAEDISEQLANWDEAALNESAIAFISEVNEKKLQKAVQIDNAPAQAWTDYGRFLMNNGRYEEALKPLKKAAELDPQLSALHSDIQFCVSRLLGENNNENENLDDLLESANQRLGDKRESRDFYSWHSYAMLMLRKSYKSRPDISSLPDFSKCKQTLVSALLCGRSSEKSITLSANCGTFGYYGSSVTGLEGFGYSEANTDFLILRSLRILSSDPGNRLAHMNLLVSFIELSEIDLAEAALGTCKQLGLFNDELLYAEALINNKRGNKAAALSLLEKLIEMNPRHKNGLTRIGDHYAERGDPIMAARYIALRDKYYPKGNMMVSW